MVAVEELFKGLDVVIESQFIHGPNHNSTGTVLCCSSFNRWFASRKGLLLLLRSRGILISIVGLFPWLPLISLHEDGGPYALSSVAEQESLGWVGLGWGGGGGWGITSIAIWSMHSVNNCGSTVGKSPSTRYTQVRFPSNARPTLFVAFKCFIPKKYSMPTEGLEPTT